MRAMLWTLFALSAWAQPATVVAGTTYECVVLASVRFVGVDTDSHCRGSHYRCGRCCGLRSLSGRGNSQPLLANTSGEDLHWPLIARSACAQPATVVEGTTGERAALDSVSMFGVGSASHCGGGNDK